MEKIKWNDQELISMAGESLKSRGITKFGLNELRDEYSRLYYCKTSIDGKEVSIFKAKEIIEKKIKGD